MGESAVRTPDADATRIRLGYRRARTLTAEHGRTYYAAACLLPGPQRRGVFALYAFARIVDDVVDRATTDTAGPSAARLDHIETALDATLRPRPGVPPRPTVPAETDLDVVLAALRDTVDRFRIPADTFEAFLRSMRMDAPGTAEFRDRYRTWDELADYTYGSAAVIGLQMVPLLGVADATPEMRSGAAKLGEAFQLTNFLRDVAEDLDRGRIYLPTDELAMFGVDEAHLRWCRSRGTTSRQLARALAHMIAVNRSQYRQAWPAITLLPNRSRHCVLAAAAAYRDILGEVERGGYQVMDHRAVVSRRRRAMRVAQAVVGYDAADGSI